MGCYISKVWRRLKAKRGKRFKKFLEGESSRMWGGVCMVTILLTSLIWWDHPHPFNHFIFSYIIIGFSWKILSTVKQSWEKDCWKNRLEIGWRILFQLILEVYIFPSIFWRSYSCKSRNKYMCVLERRTTRNLWHQGISVVSSTFIQYNIATCFFPIKLLSFYYMTPWSHV